MSPTHSSPTLRTASRLHRHAALAHCKRVSISAVIPVSRTLKAMRHGRLHGCFLYIRHRRVECRFAKHFLCFRNLRWHAGCLTRVGVANSTCEVELVMGTVDERGYVCIRGWLSGCALRRRSGSNTRDLRLRVWVVAGIGLLDQVLAIFLVERKAETKVSKIFS